jgi:uncharacterized UPF0160 family protein
MIYTHNGIMHTDELGAIATLRCAGISDQVIRTRDLKKIPNGSFLIDLGMEYDETSNKFDHHQQGGAGLRANGVPYASFGLVWKHFGLQAVSQTLSLVIPHELMQEIDFNILVSKVVDLVDASLVQGIDARDNGIKTHHGLNNASPYTVSDVISAFNAPWYINQNDNDLLFQEALNKMISILKNEIVNQSGAVLADQVVYSMIKDQDDNKIIILDRFVPWGNVIPQKCANALYVVFKDITGSYRVQAVPVGIKKESFELRAPLPTAWRGKTRDELAQITRCEDIIFVHNAGFIMGTTSYESAIYCAELAVSVHEGNK